MPEAATPRRPLLLGHRGSPKSAPENTIAAMNAALKHGCDGFEFDVRATSDGRLVLCHDETVRGAAVASTSHAELAKLLPPKRSLLGKADETTGLCSLEDVLEQFGQSAWLDIEMKVAGAEEELVTLLRKKPPKHGYVVSSFLPEVLTAVHALYSAIPLGLIFRTKRSLLQVAELPLTHVMPEYKMLDKAMLKAFHEAGKKVIAWTVNDPRYMQNLAAENVDGVISDETRLLIHTLGGTK